MQTQYPATHLLNPAFQYVPSEYTDIRATFERARRKMLQHDDIDIMINSWFIDHIEEQ